MNISRTLPLIIALFSSACSAQSAAKPVLEQRCPDAMHGSRLDSATIDQALSGATEPGNLPRIFKALGKKRHAQLQQLLQSGENPNVCGAGVSPLMIAVALNDYVQALLLLDGGAHPDLPVDSNGDTPLMLALSGGKFEVARLLLSRGAVATRASDASTNTLHQLSIAPTPAEPDLAQQQLALAQDLIEAGVDVNARSGANQSTPLMLAALRGNSELIGLLLRSGADATLKNARGQTALSFAQKRGHSAVVDMLSGPRETSNRGKATQ